MDKRQLYHIWTIVRRIKPWYFLVVAAVSGTVCVLALRQNNLEMAKLRTAVYTADKSGAGIQGSLQKLQVYVASHMNTELAAGPNAPYPPVQLEYTYDRAVQAAGNAASAANAQVYTDAQRSCESSIPNGFSGRYRITCVQTYIDGHGARLPSIPDSLYKFDFVSPTWSPDLAGWCLLIMVASLLAFVGVWIMRRYLKASTK